MHAACVGVGKRIGAYVTARPVRACLLWRKADLNLCSISPPLCGRSYAGPGLQEKAPATSGCVLATTTNLGDGSRRVVGKAKLKLRFFAVRAEKLGCGKVN